MGCHVARDTQEGGAQVKVKSGGGIYVIVLTREEVKMLLDGYGIQDSNMYVALEGSSIAQYAEDKK